MSGLGSGHCSPSLQGVWPSAVVIAVIGLTALAGLLPFSTPVTTHASRVESTPKLIPGESPSPTDVLRVSGGAHGPPPPRDRPAIGAPAVPPYVTETLTLWNNSLEVGNVLSANDLGPGAIVYDTGKGEIFLANPASDSVSVLVESTHSVVAIIPVPTDPIALAYGPSSGEVFVLETQCPAELGPLCGVNGSVSVISDSLNSVVASVSVGVYPQGLTYDGGLRELFVSDELTGQVNVISTDTNSIVANVTVGKHPTGLTYDSADSEVFVLNSESANVSVIADATNSVVASIPVGIFPQSLTWGNGTGEVFVVSGLGNLSAISTASNDVVATITPGGPPEGLAYDTGTGRLYATEPESDNVSVISPAPFAVVATIAVGTYPYGIAYAEGAGRVLVTNAQSGNLSVISDSTDSVVATFNVGSAPAATVFDPVDSDLYVADAIENAVDVLSTVSNQVVARIDVGLDPDALTYDRARGEVFVANFLSNNVSVIDAGTGKVVASIPVGIGPDGLAYDNGTGSIYVADEGSDNVSVISDTLDMVFDSVSVGTHPDQLAYDFGRSEIFVTNTGSDNISLISPTSDRVIGVISSPGGPEGLAYDNRTGEVFVANSTGRAVNVVSDATNATVATVSLGEAGFPDAIAYDAGDASAMALSGFGSNCAGCDVPGRLTEIPDSTDQTNGTTAVGTGATSIAVDNMSGDLYVTNLYQGTVSILSTASPCVQACFPVTATETGLPGGVEWFFNVSGEPGAGTNTSVATVELPNGTYSFSVSSVWVAAHLLAVTPVTGTFRVAGAAVAVPIRFYTPLYNVTFRAIGLPAGAHWTVVANGTSVTSMLSSIGYELANGSYSYSVTPPSGYSALTLSGSVNVNGANVTISVQLQAGGGQSYVVTFQETGLPTGVPWYANVTGETVLETTRSDAYSSLPDGSYTVHYAAANTTYRPAPNVASFSVSGANQIEYLSFTEVTFAVNFTEVGLPTGSNWTLVVNGGSHSTTQSSIVLPEPNGTLTFSAATPSGYTATPSTGSYTVSGSSGSIRFEFIPSTRPPPPTTPASRFLGLPGSEGYVVVAAVVAGLAAMALVGLLYRRRGGAPGETKTPSGKPAASEDNEVSTPSPNAEYWNRPK
jgi:YVTN family beta-propeller protein